MQNSIKADLSKFATEFQKLDATVELSWNMFGDALLASIYIYIYIYIYILQKNYCIAELQFPGPVPWTSSLDQFPGPVPWTSRTIKRKMKAC